MDLRFTPEENAFGEEVRAFMRAALPETIRRKMVEGRRLVKEDVVTWQRILNKKGWAVPHWPVAWGGTGWTPVQQYIFRDEMQQAPAPEPLAFGTHMVGPVIATFGSDAQKRRFLPRIANLDDWWCQGFSEPGAGSDLASLKTIARRDGDDYIVNGQKTWTTLAQYADWIFCLVRTDPAAKKQEGISFLLIDMKTPGMTVRPIQTIDGGHEVNEVFFDDVLVPAQNRVGEENKGWDYAKFLLGNERIGIARVGISKARIRRLKEIAAFERSGDKRLIEDERFAMKIAAVEVQLKALEMTQLRVVAAERDNDGKLDPASSMLKIRGSEIQQSISELLLEAVGPYALPDQAPHDESERWNEPPIGPESAGPQAPHYFNWRKASIYGGSNEIQKNIIAKAILGL
jgi:pimeloyl-CoA dehydrogenase large subunit